MRSNCEAEAGSAFGPLAAPEASGKEARPIHEYMRRMAPGSCSGSGEEIAPLSAIMCSVMILNSVIERTGNRKLEEHGLTMAQWMALGCVGHAGDEGISHSHLGQRLMLSKAPITGIVDRLERAGLVERRADAHDRRVSRAVITPEGQSTWKRVKDALRGSTQSICGDALSPGEQDELLTLLGRILDAFSRFDPTLTELNPCLGTAANGRMSAEGVKSARQA
jgi:MarR family 2-MHQ and catechol resistance regulon transcriptional repressor